MAKSRTQPEILGEWQRLLTTLTANSGELAHMEVSRAKLEALVAQAMEIHKVQAAQKAAKQEASKRLRALMSQGQRLATLLRQAVKEHYGIEAEKLSEFDLQPFRGRARKVAPTEPGEPGPTAPNPNPPTSTPAATTQR